MPTYRINLGQNGCPGKKIKVRKMPKRLLCVLELENSPGKDAFTVEFTLCSFRNWKAKNSSTVLMHHLKTMNWVSPNAKGWFHITLKEYANLKDSSNWRPITLPNVDYKITSEVISTKIEKIQIRPALSKGAILQRIPVW